MDANGSTGRKEGLDHVHAVETYTDEPARLHSHRSDQWVLAESQSPDPSRLGLGLGEDDTAPINGPTSPIEYQVYKIRWFGLTQLILLNIIVSWDVRSQSSPIIT